MTYTWEILKFSTRDQINSDGATLPNSVVSIAWRRTGLDPEGESASIVGYTTLTAKDVSEEAFVPFASLTEDVVVNWLESTISTERMNDYNDRIQQKINNLVTTDREVPWS